MHYVKIWSSSLTGSLRKNPRARHVLFDLCLIATARGEVDMTFDAISGATGVPEEDIREAVAFLEQPDPDSRRSEEGGRRLVRLDPNRSWGWRIVNFEYYRGLRAQDHGSTSAERMAAKRARDRASQSVTPSQAVTARHRRPHVPPGSRQKVEGRGEGPSSQSVPPLACEPLRTAISVGAELPLGSTPDRCPVQFPVRGGVSHGVTDDEIERLAEIYPDLDVRSELSAMAEWLHSNPGRWKTDRGMPRFITGWLQREAKSRPGARAAPRARDRPTEPVVAEGRDAISQHLAGKGDTRNGDQAGAEGS